ncbi:MAG: type VI secretion system-associated FHA domain protein TagH [Gammaproteobacteria bacterium]|nr:type VI secretion system-associated FHA domain protein TagH [Gammaproteobacteria bacterium]
MPLHLKIVSEHRDLVGDDAEREFDESGGTIGRSLENDWVLPDPDRFISGRHATIDYKAGMFYLLDTSSNGVYINDEVEPIGKGNTRRIFGGDSIRMGNFEIATSIDSGESIAVPLDSGATEAPDNNLQRVDEASHNSDLQLLDEEEITGDEEFHNTLFGSSDKDAARGKAKDAANDDRSTPRQASRPLKSHGRPANIDTLFDAFLGGVGIDRESLHPSINSAQIMETAGYALRGLVEGIISLLSSRASLKNAFRLDQTTLLPQKNNPLKFSENSEDLLRQLLLGSEGDYLGAPDAVREVCQDLLNHQNAFLDAMNAAFIEFSDRFDPAELQEGFDRTMTGFKQLPMVRKAKYWDLYVELYPVMTEKGGGRFPQMFGEEFIRAYERQIAEYRRHNRVTPNGADRAAPAIDPGLKDTRRLDQSDLSEPAPKAAIKADNDLTVEIRPPGRKLNV